MNERSILRKFAGKSPRRASDECPVPKSSMASWIPSAARASISSFSPGRGTIVAVSVISSVMRAGLQPALSIRSAIAAAPICWQVSGGMLSDMWMS